MGRTPTSIIEKLRKNRSAGKKAMCAAAWSWLAYAYRRVIPCSSKESSSFLFYGHSRVIVRHQIRFFQILKRRFPDAECRIVLFGMDEKTEAIVAESCLKHGLKTIHNWVVPFRFWSVCVIADHSYQDEFVPNETSVLFIYHGLGSIKMVNGENYKYGDTFVLNKYGRLKYDVMFEAGEFQKEYASMLAPKLKEVLSVVGDLEVDSFLRMCSRRQQLKEELNYSEGSRILLVQSTWSSNSLEQRLGEPLFGMCEKLAELLDLKVIFSSHPTHWGGRSDIEDRSEFYLSRESENIRVLRPDEDRHPFMAIADVCLSDITTLSTIFSFSKRPLVFSVGDSNSLDSGSELAKLIDACPTGDSCEDLKDLICKAFSNKIAPAYTDLLPQFCKYPGGASGAMMKEVANLLEEKPAIK